jgi:hypothetical protein
MNTRIYAVVALTAVMLVAGCAGGGPAKGPRTQCQPVDQASAMLAARDVLTGMGFTLDKYDIEAGVLTTNPLTGAQFFEVWRGDNASRFDSAEANLHSLQRAVEMTFTQSDGKLCMLCDVKVRRLSLPEREVTGTSGAATMYTKSSALLMDTRLNPGQAARMAWVDMDSDGALAEKVLAGIDKQLGQGKGQAR